MNIVIRLLLRLMGYTWIPPKHKPLEARAEVKQEPKWPIGDGLWLRETQEIHVRRTGLCSWTISIPAVAPIRLTGDVSPNARGIRHPSEGDRLELHVSSKVHVDGREFDLGQWILGNRWAIERVTGHRLEFGSSA